MKTTTTRTALFGPFELNVRSGELRKFGTRMKMGEQAFQILCMLLENPGEMVTREQLRLKLWPQDTFVDFDHGLNSAVQRLRDCLSDSAAEPRWIETIPRRGYRFVAPVEWLDESALSAAVPQNGGGNLEEDSIGRSTVILSSKRELRGKKLFWALGLFTVTLLAAIVIAREAMPSIPEPKALRFRKLTSTPALKSCPYSAGNLVYFNQQEGPDAPSTLMQLSTTGGDALSIPTPLGEPLVIDISADGAKLLLATGEHALHDLWIVPVPGGSPQRVGDIKAQDAAFSSDASKIIFANGNSLFEVGADGARLRKLLTASGFLDSPGWSPDGKRIRYRQTPAYSRNGVLWEASSEGSNPHLLFSGIGGLCCGTWTSDGKYFVYYSRREGEEGFWAVRENSGWLRKANSKAVLLAPSTMLHVCGWTSRSGNQIFVTGEQPQAELIRFNSHSRQFLPFLGGLSAEYVSFSRDGNWVAYTTYPEGELWRSRVDGSERLKLTGAMRTLSVEWSPDGKQISFAAKQPESALYVISADGGAPQRLPSGDAPVLSHSWSPHGESMVIGEWIKTAAPVLRMLDVKTNQLSVVPGSEGMLFPAWSPDGRYISASITEGPKKGGWLYELSTHRWKSLPIFGPCAWSHDGQSVYCERPSDGGAALVRVRVANGTIEKVVSLKGIRRADGAFGQWFGLDNNDVPVVLRDTSSRQIYALDWEAP